MQNGSRQNPEVYIKFSRIYEDLNNSTTIKSKNTIRSSIIKKRTPLSGALRKFDSQADKKHSSRRACKIVAK